MAINSFIHFIVRIYGLNYFCIVFFIRSMSACMWDRICCIFWSSSSFLWISFISALSSSFSFSSCFILQFRLLQVAPSQKTNTTNVIIVSGDVMYLMNSSIILLVCYRLKGLFCSLIPSVRSRSWLLLLLQFPTVCLLSLVRSSIGILWICRGISSLSGRLALLPISSLVCSSWGMLVDKCLYFHCTHLLDFWGYEK